MESNWAMPDSVVGTPQQRNLDQGLFVSGERF